MSRKRDKHSHSDEEAPVLTKKEEEIAKYIRFNCPTSTTLFEGNEVHYFSGYKAVDTLWNSKYGNKDAKNPMFKTRDDCYHYISDLFSKQLFFRAKKLVPKKKEDKDKGVESDAPKSPKKGAEKKREKKDDPETETDDKKKEDENQKQDDEKKKKKKVKLLVHPTQVFSDDKDVYVWIFDPTPLYKKIIGVLMLLGTIVGCLFPLWPMWLRQAVYYLSIGGLGVFASIIIVAILRTILFAIIYAVTLGKHKLWILPNLTEDCGVIESFQPWYTYEYCPDTKKDKKTSKKQKAKESDDEKDNDGNSTDDNYEKVNGEEVSEEASSVPASPEGVARKRRPAKV